MSYSNAGRSITEFYRLCKSVIRYNAKLHLCGKYNNPELVYYEQAANLQVENEFRKQKTERDRMMFLCSQHSSESSREKYKSYQDLLLVTADDKLLIKANSILNKFSF